MPRHTGLQFHYVIADPKVGEQHIQTKYSKCNSFQVTQLIYSTVKIPAKSYYTAMP